MTILQYIPDIIDTGLKVVGTAAAVAAVVPGGDRPASKLNIAYRVLDILACNWGRAKNKDK